MDSETEWENDIEIYEHEYSQTVPFIIARITFHIINDIMGIFKAWFPYYFHVYFIYGDKFLGKYQFIDILYDVCIC